MPTITTDRYIEAVLFHKASPVSISDLTKVLDVSTKEIETGLDVLSEKLKDRGITLVRKDNSVMLGTHTDTARIIEEIINT